MPKGHHDNQPKADRQHRWNAGKMITAHGYVKLRVGRGHPLADPNGYAYERVVVWCAAGHQRPAPGFVLHHRNEVKSDNRLENLQLVRRGAHNREHNRVRQRCPHSGRFLPKAAGRLLDGRTHDGFPELR